MAGDAKLCNPIIIITNASVRQVIDVEKFSLSTEKVSNHLSTMTTTYSISGNAQNRQVVNLTPFTGSLYPNAVMIVSDYRPKSWCITTADEKETP
ncbi:hypothetical protein BJ165DRAFT_1522945 [Panaeolus papilionaceus]|nr:hypothetical protein BJ165DRAFT_1522945 [Panaeolus papilionaceus]